MLLNVAFLILPLLVRASELGDGELEADENSSFREKRGILRVHTYTLDYIEVGRLNV